MERETTVAPSANIEGEGAIRASFAIDSGRLCRQDHIMKRAAGHLGGCVTGLDTRLRLDFPTEEEGTTVSPKDDVGRSSSESIPRINRGMKLGTEVHS